MLVPARGSAGLKRLKYQDGDIVIMSPPSSSLYKHICFLLPLPPHHPTPIPLLSRPDGSQCWCLQLMVLSTKWFVLHMWISLHLTQSWNEKGEQGDGGSVLHIDICMRESTSHGKYFIWKAYQLPIKRKVRGYSTEEWNLEGTRGCVSASVSFFSAELV